MRILCLILMLCASSVAAQDGMQEADERLSLAQLTELLPGQVLEFYTGGLGSYYADGTYDYRYEPDGERVPGVYEIKEDSSVCTVFVNGFERCDYIVRSGDRLVMIIANGERYPVREIAAIK